MNVCSRAALDSRFLRSPVDSREHSTHSLALFFDFLFVRSALFVDFVLRFSFVRAYTSHLFCVSFRCLSILCLLRRLCNSRHFNDVAWRLMLTCSIEWLNSNQTWKSLGSDILYFCVLLDYHLSDRGNSPLPQNSRLCRCACVRFTCLTVCVCVCSQREERKTLRRERKNRKNKHSIFMEKINGCVCRRISCAEEKLTVSSPQDK